MKKINKSEEVPTPLAQHAVPTSAADIDAKVYSSPQVRTQLLQDQGPVCAYCEWPIEGPFSDVEHFRPKTSYRQTTDDVHHRPGYYWLAYDWQNLLFACNVCNRTLKRDLFPLADPSQRNIAGQDISKEQPLLLNPVVDDPAEHIFYREAVAVPVLHDGIPDVRGSFTIDFFQLNTRRPLLDARRKVWEVYSAAKHQWTLAQAAVPVEVPDDVRESLCQLLEESREVLRKITAPDSPFAGMFRGRGEEYTV
jgi:uncharacterized protein (TIGR02646 family)